MPVVKKGRGEVIGEYRGVTLMPTLYKIYAAVLAERLKEKIERKGVLSPNQVGFRKGRGMIDNIYVLNYLVNRQIGKKEGGGVGGIICRSEGSFRLSEQGGGVGSDEDKRSEGGISGKGRGNLEGDEM